MTAAGGIFTKRLEQPLCGLLKLGFCLSKDCGAYIMSARQGGQRGKNSWHKVVPVRLVSIDFQGDKTIWPRR